MTRIRSIKWQLVFIASLGTVIFLLAALVVFVAFYGHFVDPGREQAFYSKFALDTSEPLLFCLSPFVMYIVSRWLAGKAGRAFYLHALLFLILYYVLDTSLLLFTPGMDWPAFFGSFVAVKHLLVMSVQVAGVLVGARLAERECSAKQNS